MTGLPDFGDKVKIWPNPTRLVQDGARAVGAGGRWLAREGREVAWGAEHVEQLRAGDLLLHAPPCEKHDFGQGGKAAACVRCGRFVKEAKDYDDARAAGIEAAKKATPDSAATPEDKE